VAGEPGDRWLKPKTAA